MSKYLRTDAPNLLCLDTRVPWTEARLEAVQAAVGNSRLSGIEIEPFTIALMVRTLAGELNGDEAVQIIIQHYLKVGTSDAEADR